MGDFFEKIGRFFVNLMIIGLILLISVQIVLKDDTAYNRLKKMEMAVKSIIPGNKVVQVVEQKKNIRKGIITLDLLEDLSLPQVWLLRNGQRVANFTDGVVRVKVTNGDLLSIDSRSYSNPLWFEVTSASSLISWEIGKQFRTDGDVKSLGIIEFNNKL